MFSSDDFQYALENTKVILPPEKRLETFGTSVLNYFLITEDMDRVDVAHVREGSIVAERPQIISPENIAKLLLEGFGPEAGRFAEMVNQNAQRFAVLKYGFRIRKADIRGYEVHEAMGPVAGRVRDEVKARQDPLAAVITGIEEGWEVCLLKFMFDLVQSSGEGNLRDLRDRGLI
ncbi:MAG: hypothetical protein SFU85_02795 [Candidatus Methylacidiphilales bacterium]|nr:hypothetical protein [Candidatus Methylacidiphilales bacterium]